MTTFAGSWVDVTSPAGSLRRDWVPAEQPASPDGSSGRWHVVTDHPDADPRWEWHPAPAAAAPAVRAPRPKTPLRVPQDLNSNVRRGCMAAMIFGVLMPWATVGPFSITGSSLNDGKILMAVGGAALALSFAPRFFLVRLMDLALAVAALLAALADAGNMSKIGSKLGPLFNVEIGSGLRVCVAAAGLWVVALVWEQWQRIGARRRDRSRYTPPAWYQQPPA